MTANALEQIRNGLVARFPGLEAEIDEPTDPEGPWLMDVRPEGGPWIVVEWRPRLGFGISTPDPDDLGTRPDEMLHNAAAARDRLVGLIESQGRTEPPSAATLAELRKLAGMSQAAVGVRAGVKQPTIARVEDGGDLLVSTARKVVAAMGGTLRMVAVLPDGSERELIGLGVAEAAQG